MNFDPTDMMIYTISIFAISENFVLNSKDKMFNTKQWIHHAYIVKTVMVFKPGLVTVLNCNVLKTYYSRAQNKTRQICERSSGF